MNLSLDDLDNVIRAMKVADVYCAMEDVPRISQAVADAGIAGTLTLTPHPSIDPGMVLVLKHGRVA